MEKLKIIINGNEYIANKAKEFFSELGYHISAHNRNNAYGWSLGDGVGDYYGNKKSFDEDVAREITIQELHDMVVLKLNDCKDRTHVDSNNYDWYVASDEKHYRHQGSIWVHQPYVSCLELKPIQKEQPMKEFLVKVDGKYELNLLDVCEHPDAIEVPDGANILTKSGSELYFWNTLKNETFVHGEGWKFCDDVNFVKLDDYTIQNDAAIIWQRAPNQETIDAMNSGESEYLMQGANGVNLMESIEQLKMGESGSSKKHSHYKKDVSKLDIVDVYRVLELFEVKSHSVGHAVKKLLCSGKRGAKDEKKDIQEAIDSLQRHLEMLEEDER